MSTIIRAENLAKRYVLRHEQVPPYATLRDSIANGIKRLGRRSAKRADEDFWALRDVSFDVTQGDRVGIIGRNGAGKSTLLKILSRITEPSAGRVRIRGRVASLLEVGTGFHGELTGRENIFLNGAILGMSRAEILSKFDAIVDFAEIERFLDTPVKRYSSGMYVRLAFAVAAHLEPEILIVDEVLAVGDAQFQSKCLGKMKEIGRGGRTVLFVSHDIQAVRRLCTHGLLLDAGRVVAAGPVKDVTDQYFQRANELVTSSDLARLVAQLPRDPAFELRGIALTQAGRRVVGPVQNGLPLDVTLDYRAKQAVRGMRVFIDLQDDQGSTLFRTFHDDAGHEMPVTQPGDYVSTATIPANLLAAYPHLLCVKATIHNVRYTMPEEGICIPLQVERTGHYNPAYHVGPVVGRLDLPIAWRTRAVVPAPAEAALHE